MKEMSPGPCPCVVNEFLEFVLISLLSASPASLVCGAVGGASPPHMSPDPRPPSVGGPPSAPRTGQVLEAGPSLTGVFF